MFSEDGWKGWEGMEAGEGRVEESGGGGSSLHRKPGSRFIAASFRADHRTAGTQIPHSNEHTR